MLDLFCNNSPVSFFSMEELERFVRHFAGDKTVITPCAIPPKSSKEDVKRTLASWLCPPESSNSASSQPSHSSQELFSLSLSPHKPEPSVISNPDRFSKLVFDSNLSNFSGTGMTQTCFQAPTSTSALIGKGGRHSAGCVHVFANASKML